MNAIDTAAYNPYRPLVAKRAIEQSPHSSAPTVPAGAAGWLEDVADDLLWIDFGDPYGVIACEPGEVRS